MKLLIVGSALTGALELEYKKNLNAIGLETDIFDIHGQFFSYYHASLQNKLLFRTGLSSILPKLNEALLSHIQQTNPTHIWVFKGMEIYPSTLKKIKKMDKILVNYNPDNPFIFTGKGSGNRNITNSINLYDIHFSYDDNIIATLKSKGLRVEKLPFGYEVSESLFNQCANEKEIIKLCFLGNPDRNRAIFIKDLAEKGVKMDLYGFHWEKFVKHENLNCYPAVFKEEFWKTLRKYRIQLNLMRIHNENSHNMRTFEIPAIGGIQLAPDTLHHRSYFTDSEDIFLYKNVKDCLKQINRLLNLSSIEADRIRERTRSNLLNSKSSYEDRAKFVKTILQKISST